jgi:hypothetical protein
MRSRWTYFALGVFTLQAIASVSPALTFPFTENFASSDANWKDNASLPLSYVATGGADGGGYVSTDFSFDGLAAGPTLFRGQGNFDSSGDAFVGNWLTAGVGEVRAYVRHDAPVAIDYFVRIATANNFPGLAIELSQSVPAGDAWTLLKFNTSASNPLLTVEGPPNFYASAMGAVGNVQFGVSLPESLTMDATAYTFDLDGVSIAVPEPTTFGLVLVGLAAVGLGRGGLRSRRG